ncbi:lipase [Nocardia puris]|uniref:Secretory lipase n=1 Tax=Nocardia puris TaxID=208602 RepID=A0A366DXH0_9NOCA|nr:lipase family protein [Nocardia puris]MBF6210462.1 lipase [Nocardia puris]MBF6367537.1 lipase [Nocardia puris]MBF6457722.1 lipase [Nocardia puris]RBO93888.1 secretory lipase [Nocardia puris]
MRCLPALVTTVLLALPVLAGSAAAQPPPPPVIPGIPDLSGLPPLPDASGSLLPGLQEWIDRVIPPPLVAPPPVPDVAAPEHAVLSPTATALHAAVLPAPVGDPIFDAWPAHLADLAPGEIIEVRDVTPTAAMMVLMPFERALLTKYRTADAYGRPSFATATLVVPATPWPGPEGRPVLVNNLPINALGRECAPGYSMAHGWTSNTGITDFLPPTTQLALLRGYAVLIPDHEGPRMAYAEPYVAGHAVLDGIRAVRALLPAEFGTSRFALTGYSGGAIATHGAVKLLAGYAPELTGVVAGAALGGVPADYEILARSMNGNLASAVFMGAVFGIGRERPGIVERMNNLAGWIATSPVKDTCSSTFGAVGILLLPIDIAANFPDPLRSEFAEEIYRVTRMENMASAVPLYIYNGEQEWWIPAEGARNLYHEQCRLGVTAVYRGVPGEHLIGAVVGYPEAVGWLDERLRGIPAVSEC